MQTEDVHVRVERFIPFPLKMKNATLLGYADIVLNNFLLIRGIKLLKKPNGGIFIGLPSIQVKEGEFIEIVEILDRKIKEKIRKTVSDYFKEHYGDFIA
ncbi:MAG: hypothetical protein GXN97_04185 [Aquificae bacterium]|jgi:DNA-binding cell septation regulator SpoVG|nr:hypothetical protein [Aquificota bacterium]